MLAVAAGQPAPGAVGALCPRRRRRRSRSATRPLAAVRALPARAASPARYDAAHQFLLDNRSYEGRAGYEVLTPLARPGATTLLVDRGWVPFSGSRAQLPDGGAARGHHGDASAGGWTSCRVAGLGAGARRRREGAWPKVTSFPDMAELVSALRRAARAAHPAARCAGAERLRARLAAAGHVPAAALLLRGAVVGVRGAGAHRVAVMLLRQPTAACMSDACRRRCARATCAPSALLAALFLLPLVLAFCIYYGSSWRPAGSVNHGVLSSRRGRCRLSSPRPGRPRRRRHCSAASGRWSTWATAPARPRAARRSTSCARRASRSTTT